MLNEREELFADENPDSVRVEDAEHWVRVYTELTEFARRMRAYEDGRGGESLGRLERRRRYWERRLRELRTGLT